MLDTLSPSRRRFVLLVVLGVLVAAIVGTSVLVVRVRHERVRPVAQGDPGPVLLVSGYGGSTSSLAPLAAALRETGRDVVVVPAVGDGTDDIDAQAVALGKQAESALTRFHVSSVDVVGYSAGGVVARTWVRDHGGGSVARRVLSVGSPQHGTTVAEQAVGLAGGCPQACEQLAPDSELLRSLNARDESPPGPVFVSVWSTADRTVVPADSAHLSGAVNLTVQSVCPRARTSHGALPGDPVVLALLGSALGRAAPTVPTGVGC